MVSADRTSDQIPEVPIRPLSAGSRAKAALLDPLNASKSRAGDPLKALLEEPLSLNSGQVLPEGTIFEGHVTKSIRPRWLSRQGSLYVTFTRRVIPRRSGLAMAASIEGIDVSRRARIKINPEGGMSGGVPARLVC